MVACVRDDVLVLILVFYAADFIRFVKVININFFMMTSLKFKMYSSLIFGKLGVLTGLYLFINNSDKTAGKFFILMGLSSLIIGFYILLTINKKALKKITS